MENITKNNIGIKIANKDNYISICSQIDGLIYSDKDINRAFDDKRKELYSADILSTIYNKQNNELIGFAGLVERKHNKDFYFLSIGIKEKYRGNQIASHILEELNGISQRFIIAEAKENNTLANNSLKSKSALLRKKGNINVYLVQKNKLEEFYKHGYKHILDYHYDHLDHEMITCLYNHDMNKKGRVKIKTK